MDDGQFDLWTKALSHSRTRRATFRALTSGGVASLGWLVHAPEAAACRKNGKKCKKGKQCCSKKCKGKKCRCKPLEGACPGAGADHVCCPNAGSTVACSFMLNKAQCGPNGFRCLRAIDSPCSDDCQCAGELECDGSPATRCCTGLGNACTEGTGESQCCS